MQSNNKFTFFSNKSDFLKVFANLLLDSAISGSQLEGSLTTQVGQYTQVFFQNLDQVVGSYFDQKDPNNPAVKELKNHADFFTKTFFAIDDLKSVQPGKMAEEIIKLQSNQSKLLAGGWSAARDVSSSGHDLLYQFIKKDNGTLQFRVINTGGGLSSELHKPGQWEANPKDYLAVGKIKYYPVIYELAINSSNESIMKKQLAGFIHGIMEPRKAPKKNNANAAYVYDTAIRNFEILGGKPVNPAQEPNIRPYSEQFSGSCVGKTIRNVVKFKVSDNAYHWFKLLLTYQSCWNLIDHLKYHFNENEQKFNEAVTLLEMKISNLVRYASFNKIKLDHQHLLRKVEEMEQAIKKLKKKNPPIKQFKFKKTSSPPSELQYNDSLKKLKFLKIKQSKEEKDDTDVSFPRYDYYKIPTKKSTLQRLEALEKALEKESRKWDPYSIITAVENIAFDLSEEESKENFACKNDKELLKLTEQLNNLAIIFLEYSTLYYKKPARNPAQLVTFLSLILAIKKIAENNNTLPSFFSKDMAYFLNKFLQKNNTGYICTGNPRHDQKLKKIKTLLNNTSLENKDRNSKHDESSEIFFRFACAYKELLENNTTEEEKNQINRLSQEALKAKKGDLAGNQAKKTEPYTSYYKIRSLKKNGNLEKFSKLKNALDVHEKTNEILSWLFGNFCTTEIKGFSVEPSYSWSPDEKFKVTFDTPNIEDSALDESIKTFRGKLSKQTEETLDRKKRFVYDETVTPKEPHFYNFEHEDHLTSNVIYCDTINNSNYYGKTLLNKRKLLSSRSVPSAQILLTLELFWKNAPELFQEHSKLLEINLFDGSLLFEELHQFGNKRLELLNDFLKWGIPYYLNNTDNFLNFIKIGVFLNHYALSMLSVEKPKNHGKICDNALVMLDFMEGQISRYLNLMTSCPSHQKGLLHEYRSLIIALKLIYQDIKKDGYKDLCEKFILSRTAAFEHRLPEQDKTCALNVAREEIFKKLRETIDQKPQIANSFENCKLGNQETKNDASSASFQFPILKINGISELNLMTGEIIQSQFSTKRAAPQEINLNLEFRAYFHWMTALPRGRLNSQKTLFSFVEKGVQYRMINSYAWKNAQLQRNFSGLIFPSQLNLKKEKESWYYFVDTTSQKELIESLLSEFIPLIEEGGKYWISYNKTARNERKVIFTNKEGKITYFLYSPNMDGKFKTYKVENGNQITAQPISPFVDDKLSLFETPLFVSYSTLDNDKKDQFYFHRYNLTLIHDKESKDEENSWIITKKTGDEKHGQVLDLSIYPHLPQSGFIFQDTTTGKRWHYLPLQRYKWNESTNSYYFEPSPENLHCLDKDQLDLTEKIERRYWSYPLDASDKPFLQSAEAMVRVIYIHLMQGNFDQIIPIIRDLNNLDFSLTEGLVEQIMWLTQDYCEKEASPSITPERLAIKLKILVKLINTLIFLPKWPKTKNPEILKFQQNLLGELADIYLKYLKVANNVNIAEFRLSEEETFDIASYLKYRTKPEELTSIHLQYHGKKYPTTTWKEPDINDEEKSNLEYAATNTIPDFSGHPMHDWNYWWEEKEIKIDKNAPKEIDENIIINLLLLRRDKPFIKQSAQFCEILHNKKSKHHELAKKLLSAEIMVAKKRTSNTELIPIFCFLLKELSKEDYLDFIGKLLNTDSYHRSNIFDEFFKKASQYKNIQNHLIKNTDYKFPKLNEDLPPQLVTNPIEKKHDQENKIDFPGINFFPEKLRNELLDQKFIKKYRFLADLDFAVRNKKITKIKEKLESLNQHTFNMINNNALKNKLSKFINISDEKKEVDDLEEIAGEILFLLLKEKKQLSISLSKQKYQNTLKSIQSDLHKKIEQHEKNIDNIFKKEHKIKAKSYEKSSRNFPNLSAEALLNSWQRNNFDDTRKFYNLSDEDIERLKTQLTCWMIYKQQWQYFHYLSSKMEKANFGTIKGALLDSLMQINYCTPNFANLMYFQYKTKIMFWRSQWEVISPSEERLPENKNIITKIYMGGGKSTVLTPAQMVAQTQKNKLTVNCIPLSLLGDNTPSKTFHKVTGRPTHKLLFSRSLDYKLSELLEKMRLLIARKEPLIISTSSLMSLLLKPLESLSKGSTLEASEMQALTDIIQLLIDNGYTLIDEIHQEIAPKKVLNYGISQPGKIDELLIENFVDFLQIFFEEKNEDYSLDQLHIKMANLLHDESFPPLLKLDEAKENDQAQQIIQYISGKLGKSNEKWLEKISKNKNLSNWLKLLNLHLNSKQGLANRLMFCFISEHFGFPERAVENERQLEKQMKEEEKIVLDDIYMEDYLVVPYGGAQNPKSSSQFASFIETFFFTGAAFFQQGLPRGVFLHCVDAMRKQALTNQETYRLVQEQWETLVGPDYPLGKMIDSSNTEIIKECYEKVGFSPQFISYCLKNYIFTEYTLQKKLLSMNGGKLVEILGQVQGLSGTPVNYRALHHSFELSKELGCDTLLKKVLIDKKTPVITITSKDTIDWKTLFKNDPELRAVIDLAAYYKDTPNEQLAKSLVDWLKNKVQAKANQAGASTKKIRWILFFKKTGIKGNMVDTPYAMSTENYKTVELDQLDDKYFSEILDGAKPGEWFTIYDQMRCTGTDVPNTSQAQAALILRLKDTPIYRFYQACLRLRGVVKLDQKISVYVISGEKKELTLNELFDAMEESQNTYLQNQYKPAPFQFAEDHNYNIKYKLLLKQKDEEKRHEQYEKDKSTFVVEVDSVLDKNLLYPIKEETLEKSYQAFRNKKEHKIPEQATQPIMRSVGQQTIASFTSGSQEVEKEKEKEKERDKEKEIKLEKKNYKPITNRLANYFWHNGKTWDQILENPQEASFGTHLAWEGIFLSYNLIKTTKESENTSSNLVNHLDYNNKLTHGTLIIVMNNNVYGFFVDSLDFEYLSKILSKARNRKTCAWLETPSGLYAYGQDPAEQKFSKEVSNDITEIRKKSLYYNGLVKPLTEMNEPVFKLQKGKGYPAWFDKHIKPIRLKKLPKKIITAHESIEKLRLLFNEYKETGKIITGTKLYVENELAQNVIYQVRSLLKRFEDLRNREDQQKTEEAGEKEAVLKKIKEKLISLENLEILSIYNDFYSAYKATINYCRNYGTSEEYKFIDSAESCRTEPWEKHKEKIYKKFYKIFCSKQEEVEEIFNESVSLREFLHYSPSGKKEFKERIPLKKRLFSRQVSKNVLLKIDDYNPQKQTVEYYIDECVIKPTILKHAWNDFTEDVKKIARKAAKEICNDKKLLYPSTQSVNNEQKEDSLAFDQFVNDKQQFIKQKLEAIFIKSIKTQIHSCEFNASNFPAQSLWKKRLDSMHDLLQENKCSPYSLSQKILINNSSKTCVELYEHFAGKMAVLESPNDFQQGLINALPKLSLSNEHITDEQKDQIKTSIQQYLSRKFGNEALDFSQFAEKFMGRYLFIAQQKLATIKKIEEIETTEDFNAYQVTAEEEKGNFDDWQLNKFKKYIKKILEDKQYPPTLQKEEEESILRLDRNSKALLIEAINKNFAERIKTCHFNIDDLPQGSFWDEKMQALQKCFDQSNALIDDHLSNLIDEKYPSSILYKHYKKAEPLLPSDLARRYSSELHELMADETSLSDDIIKEKLVNMLKNELFRELGAVTSNMFDAFVKKTIDSYKAKLEKQKDDIKKLEDTLKEIEEQQNFNGLSDDSDPLEEAKGIDEYCDQLLVQAKQLVSTDIALYEAKYENAKPLEESDILREKINANLINRIDSYNFDPSNFIEETPLHKTMAEFSLCLDSGSLELIIPTDFQSSKGINDTIRLFNNSKQQNLATQRTLEKILLQKTNITWSDDNESFSVRYDFSESLVHEYLSKVLPQEVVAGINSSRFFQKTTRLFQNKLEERLENIRCLHHFLYHIKTAFEGSSNVTPHIEPKIQSQSKKNGWYQRNCQTLLAFVDFLNSHPDIFKSEFGVENAINKFKLKKEIDLQNLHPILNKIFYIIKKSASKKTRKKKIGLYILVSINLISMGVAVVFLLDFFKIFSIPFIGYPSLLVIITISAICLISLAITLAFNFYKRSPVIQDLNEKLQQENTDCPLIQLSFNQTKLSVLNSSPMKENGANVVLHEHQLSSSTNDSLDGNTKTTLHHKK